jgi:hypothetical protein
MLYWQCIEHTKEALGSGIQRVRFIGLNGGMIFLFEESSLILILRRQVS